MKMKHLLKKAFLLLALVGGASNAWAAAVGDLKTIATDYVFIADDITANGTVKLTANTLYDGNVIFAPTANSVATNKNSSTIEGNSHLNSLRLKNAQDRLAFKVNGACTITFYTNKDNSRGIYVSKNDNVTTDAAAYAKQTAGSTVWEVSLDAAGVYYLTSYNGDFWFAGFKVTFPKTGQPTVSTNPASAEYSQGDVATALSVSATAANEGALSYQWYKNETNQSVLAGEGATAIDGATNATYTPSTAAAGTTYYFCKVTEEGNANVATSRMAKIVVNPAGFDVTYSLGEVTGTVGTLPANESAVTSVTIPVNKTLYKDGNTLTAWNDGTADHAIKEVVALSDDVTLTPVFTANGASTYLGHNASTATWNFNNNTGAPTWDMEGSGTFVYVTQTSVGGNSMDVKMTMDATGSGAKIASNGDWTQINMNSKLTVPVITGAVVKVYTYSSAAAPTFGGNDGSFDSTNKIYSYTATADGDIDIVYGGNDYASKVTVDYPSESAVLTVSANDTKIGLTKANINAVDYLSVTTDNWVTGKTFAGYSGDFYNMSSEGRDLSIKVTGASYFEAFVRNDSGEEDRSFKLKVGTADDVTVDALHYTLVATGVYALDPSATTTITLKGTGKSVYPVYFHFNPTVPVTITEAGWATLYTDKALDFTGTGLTAYTATCSANTVALTPVTNVPANTGVVLNGNEGNYNIPVIASSETAKGDLKGSSTEATAYNAFDGYTLYVLTSVNEGANVQFNPVTSGSIAAGKAYLKINAEGASSARSMEVVFADDILTGINEAEAATEAIVKEGKFFENGKLVIFKKGMKFNANGQVIK
jgi:hypothetical protein